MTAARTPGDRRQTRVLGGVIAALAGAVGTQAADDLLWPSGGHPRMLPAMVGGVAVLTLGAISRQAWRRGQLTGRQLTAALAITLAATTYRTVLAHDLGDVWLPAMVVLGIGIVLPTERMLRGCLTAVWVTWLAQAGVVLLAAPEIRDDLHRLVASGIRLAVSSLVAGLLWRYVSGLGVALRRARAEGEARALRDALTGCLNRHGLDLFGGQLLEITRRANGGVHLLFVDVDGLKQVNDELGHRAGDEVLAAVGASLQAATRAGDVVARWGGDEFVVVASGAGTSPLELERRVRSYLAANPPVSSQVWPGAVSVGGALLEPWDDGDLLDLLHRADEDMYLRRAARRPAGREPGRSRLHPADGSGRSTF